MAHAIIRDTIGTKTFSSADMGGATPTAALIFSTGIISTNPRATGILSIGMTDGSFEAASAINSADNVGTTDETRHHIETGCLLITGGSQSGAAVLASFDSFTTNGIVLDFTTVNGAAYEITVVLFDYTVVGCARAAPGTTTSSTADLSVTGQPDIMFFVGSGLPPASLGTATTHAIISFGAAAYDGSTITQGLNLFTARDNEGTSIVNSVRGTLSVLGQAISNAINWTAGVTGVSASAITLTTGSSGATGGDIGFFLAMDSGGDAKVMEVTSPANAAVDWTVTGVGFQPDIAILATNLVQTTGIAESTGTGAFGFGFVDSHGNLSSHEISNDDAFGASQTQSRGSANFLDFSDSAGAQAFLSSGTPTLNSDGFTLADADLTTANGTVRKWCGIFIKEAVAESFPSELFKPTHNTLSRL
ncbi:MAG: hypothetical protein GKS00_09245 [Alphaproteobacteria bacterium]|nr:hypothetical protein [Alphaproteobacteria bacterium]